MTTLFVQDPRGRALLDYNGAGGAVLDWYAFGSGPNDVLNQIGATTRETYVPDIQGSIVASLDAASGALTRAQLSNFPQGQVAGGRISKLQGGFTQSVKICKAHCRQCANWLRRRSCSGSFDYSTALSGARLQRAPSESLNMANELKDAASPYLLQHADNPVHWRQWGAAALREAQAAGKPILLSVGYAACHWCHVMAHESFEDKATAAVMNELFVNIKVDREERPDIDHIYMSALHSFGERGGWPMTMFLTPDGEPFWGGTYFPKEALYGRPTFVSVLNAVAQAYRAEPERIAKNVAAVRARLAKADAAGGDAAAISLQLADEIAPHLLQAMDHVDGGLKGAPKFPNTPILEFLQRTGARLGDESYNNAATLTLQHMSEGGIYDHLGGGYARYSTDDRWLAPHFEKMLYDNAQILECLALAHHETGDELFRTRAVETVGWIEREMTAPGGAFCASLDADSEGVEGKFYVWTWDELVAISAVRTRGSSGKFYNASPDRQLDRGALPGRRHHFEPAGIGRPTAEEEARLAPLRRKLFDARAKRIRPGLDDKIMADWNGLMIAALVNAATLFHEPRWIGLAARAYDFIVPTLQYADADGARASPIAGARACW